MPDRNKLTLSGMGLCVTLGLIYVAMPVQHLLNIGLKKS